MKNSSNISKESKSEPCLPWEIIDEILVFRGDPLLAVDLDRFRTVMRIDSNATYHWAMKNRKLKYLKHLNERGLGNLETLLFHSWNAQDLGIWKS